MKNLVLDGNKFCDIDGFFTEIYKVITKDLSWPVAHNLDALNDILYGGFGIYDSNEKVVIKWKHIAKSAEDLGMEETRRWYKNKIYKIISENLIGYNLSYFENKLIELNEQNGQTLFEIILEIIADHKMITLIKD